MTLALPSSPRRRYLSGIDWAMGLLDDMTRRQTGVGNLSQIVLELEGFLPDEPLGQALAQLSARFPLIHGRVARDWLNLAPYWRPAPAGRARAIPLRVVDLAAGDDGAAQRLLHDHVNTALAGPAEHLRLLLVRRGKARSHLAAVFDHKLLDAHGGEAFLQLIDLTWQGRLEEIAPHIRTTAPAQLDHWRRRFAAGRTINGLRVQLSQKSVAALPQPPPRPGRAYRFLHDALGAERARALAERAFDELGGPLVLPWLVARAAAAMAPALAASPLTGQQQLIAISVSTRRADETWEELFFNHLSFLAFSAPADVGAASSPSQTAPRLRDQLLEQMRQDIPGALRDASLLARLCPRWLGGRLSRLPFQGRLCSFYLACLLESAFTGRTFLGLPVTNLRHTPRVPPPPGVGLCLTSFHGRWNIVLSYLEGVLDDQAARDVAQRFAALLNDQPSDR